MNGTKGDGGAGNGANTKPSYGRKGLFFAAERLWFPAFPFAREVAFADVFVKFGAMQAIGIEETAA